MTDEYDAEQELEELQKALSAAKNELGQHTIELQKASQEEQEAYQEYLKHVEVIRAKKIAADRERVEANNKALDIERKIAAIKAEEERKRREAEREAREAQAAEEAARIAEMKELESLLLRERFDKLTAGAYWREFAKEHQLEAGRYIAENRNVILADPMGLGKTLSAIITVEMVQQVTKTATPEFPFLGEEKEVYNSSNGNYEKKIVGGVERAVGQRILYLCPSSLVKNVRDEWKQWAKHRNVMFIYRMTKAERNFALEFAYENSNEYVVICNYEAWVRDKTLLEWFVKMDFDTLIIDEAHNAKDQKTSVWKGINTIITQGQPEYVIPMTGTPILNKPQELFTLLNMVAPNVFYHENDFLYTYCEQYENNNGTILWRFQMGGLDRISKRINKFFLRRTKDQAGIVLPDKTIIHHDLEVDKDKYPEQARAREEMRKYASVVVGTNKDKAIAARAVIAMFTRLRQIETWPAGIIQYEKGADGKIVMNSDGSKSISLQLDVEESQKIDYVISQDESGEWNGLIPEAIADERMVLFSQFKAPLREIKRRCEEAGIRAVIFDGETPDKVKDEVRIDFDITKTPDRSASKWDIALCNYKVGGVGLNLTAATQMFILDEEWNPGKRDQAYDRIHRIGQQKPVTIHVIRSQNTIDDWLAAIMEGKEATVSGFNDTMTDMNFQDYLDNTDDSGLM
jgi:SNF2 family DNA or RNA helicase